MTQNELRAKLRRTFGGGRYRIDSDGSIHVYGRIPNTYKNGWYLLGYADDPEIESRFDML